MPQEKHKITTVVRSIEAVARDVLEFELADPDDWELPPFTAGAHIDVHLPSGQVRQYSLCGDPREKTRYRIAVSRAEQGRGGSLELHSDVALGATVLVSLPRNQFPVVDAPHIVMIAGGIGITPFVSMAHDLARAGRSAELHYCARTPEDAAFAALLERLLPPPALNLYFSRTPDPCRIQLDEVLADVQEHTHVYCCGPEKLMSEVLAAVGPQLGDRLHIETFGSLFDVSDPDYTIELARSGRVIPVPSGQTMLQALRSAEVEVESSCEAGVCLECRLPYLEGKPIHRDLVLPEAQRGAYLTPCVSGCAGERIVLDV